MRARIASCYLLITAIITLGCGPPKEHLNIYQKEARYPQPPNFKVNETLFIRERNGSPNIMASAFLIDKQRGRFASAKHFVGSEGDGQCKIFFNGKVYDGFLLQLPPITDIAVIQISGSFDPATFPEPYKIAHQIAIGDKIFVRGIHPHPTKLQDNKVILPIFREYYGVLGREDEFVYDTLEGKITKLKVNLINKNIGGSSELLSEISNNYIGLETNDDHRFSFGGLSGGPTVNERNELVGINSSEKQGGWEMEQEGNMIEITDKPWKQFHLVPASELEKIMPQIAGIR